MVLDLPVFYSPKVVHGGGIWWYITHSPNHTHHHTTPPPAPAATTVMGSSLCVRAHATHTINTTGSRGTNGSSTSSSRPATTTCTEYSSTATVVTTDTDNNNMHTQLYNNADATDAADAADAADASADAQHAQQHNGVRVSMGNWSTKRAAANTTARTLSNMSLVSAHKPAIHVKCREETYPRDPSIKRCVVPEDKVAWSVPFPEYEPVDYTSPGVLKQPVWADYPLDTFRTNSSNIPAWNQIDGNINRISHTGKYEIRNHLPLNPVGRTGVTGRGCLGRWGPNHAADPIVTRWKRDDDNTIVKSNDTNKPILQFICIQRHDSGEWAIPGGMVDAGEQVSVTLKREFSEEAMNSLEATPEQKSEIESNVSALFKTGTEVYRGYVDDPRNTDNSWMETIAMNFHDASGDSVGQFKLNAGDDAVGVRWVDISSRIKLFASHAHFVQKVADLHKCDW